MIAQLSILDAHLAKREWVALDKLTIADIALVAGDQALPRFPDRAPGTAALEKWQAKIDARPAFQVATGAKPSTLRGLNVHGRATCRTGQTLPHPVARAVRVSSACCCSAWWLLNVASAMCRYIFGIVFIGADELLVFAMIWMVMVGMIW